jgi:hypothetical protein
MALQLLQKLRSEVHFSALAVPRSLTALYFLWEHLSLVTYQEGEKKRHGF